MHTNSHENLSSKEDSQHEQALRDALKRTQKTVEYTRFFFTIGFFCLFISGFIHSPFGNVFYVVFLMFCANTFAIFRYRALMERRLHNCTYRDISLLFDYLHAMKDDGQDRRIRERIRSTLTRLLGELSPQQVPDIAFLNPEHLVKYLETRSENSFFVSPEENRRVAQKNLAFQLAILRILPWFGTLSSLDVVQKFAQSETHNTEEACLKEAAIVCFSALKDQLDRNEAAQVMLRPVYTEPSRELLHPLEPSPKEENATLLRGSEAQSQSKER